MQILKNLSKLGKSGTWLGMDIESCLNDLPSTVEFFKSISFSSDVDWGKSIFCTSIVSLDNKSVSLSPGRWILGNIQDLYSKNDLI